MTSYANGVNFPAQPFDNLRGKRMMGTMIEHPEQRQPAPLLEMMGLQAHFRPDQECPPVDRGKLHRFLNGELTEYAEEDVLSAIQLYRNWYEEWVKITDEEIDRQAQSNQTFNQS